MPSPCEPVPRLRLRGLHKAFRDVRVLDGVDLDVAGGELVLLAGHNGSGKTTLLRCVAGLVRYGGDVLLDGRPCGRSRDSRARLGYLPQAPGLAPWATAAELLGLFRRLRAADDTVVGLPDGFLPPMDRPVAALSGGQRQRLAVAIALLGSPRLLLLDEPAANLDEDGRAALADVLHRVRARGASVVIAAPSPGELGDLGREADRTVRLVAGRVEGLTHPRDEPAGDGPTRAAAPQEVAV